MGNVHANAAWAVLWLLGTPLAMVAVGFRDSIANAHRGQARFVRRYFSITTRHRSDTPFRSM